MNNTSRLATDRVTDVGDTAVAQPSLWFDDEASQPIAYTLTPAANQLLMPGSRPTLTAVPPLVDDDTDRDPRRAQVKAMFRGGITPEAIAEQLEIDVLLVRGWLDLQPMPTFSIRPVTETSAVLDKATADMTRHRMHELLTADAQLAFAVGVLATSAEWDATSVTVTFREPRVAESVLASLKNHVAVADAQMHVIVRLSAHSHGDRARSLWAGVLGIDPAEIRTVRGRSNAVDEALVRIVHADVAATVGVLCDVALNPPAPIVDVAF